MNLKQFKQAGYTLTETVQRTAVFSVELDALIEHGKDINDPDAPDFIGGDLIKEYENDTESVYDIIDKHGVVVHSVAGVDAVKEYIENM